MIEQSKSKYNIEIFGVYASTDNMQNNIEEELYKTLSDQIVL